MNWLEKLNAKYGRFAIRNVTRYMVFAHLLGYVFYYAQLYTQISFFSWLVFEPSYILHGQIWRLVTWILVPSSSFSFWEVLFVLCLLMLGDNLERAIGSFRMTVYFLGGILLSDIGAMLLYLILGLPLINLTAYYLLFSLYLMLGLFMPDAEVRLYFILPIKMKWMLLVYAGLFAYDIINSYLSGGWILMIYSCAEMILALVNLLIFVASCKKRMSFRQSAAQAARRQQYRSQVNQGYRQNRGGAQVHPAAHNAVHKCCICGRTDVTNPELTFRYCSKCTGGREYCNDHLFTHEHR